MNPTPYPASRRPGGFARNAISLLVAVGALGTLGACSTVPERNAALDQAQSRYSAAQAQSQVATLAPEELRRASEALRVAEQAQANRESMATVDHLAYLASQRVALAQDTAASRAAEAVTAGAAAERDRMRLALRTQEAETAQRQLASSQQTNANTSQQLASSQQSNAVQQAQLARRDMQLGDLQSQLRELNARQTDRGLVVTLGDVLFALGQAQLQGDSVRTMGKLAEFFKRYPQRTAVIEGYTDSVGSEKSNQALSDRRAQAVMAALVGQGVPAARLRSEGYGEARPAGPNDSADGRRMNRRVEVVFSNETGDAPLK